MAILGGALCGSCTALLLRRAHPQLRVLLIEKEQHFGRKVGEATTEVSGEFFHRRLSLVQHLTHEHLAKQSLRMWFADSVATAFDETVEVGSDLLSSFPAYQLDRSVLDEHLLALAQKEGAEVWRPAVVEECNLGRGRARIRARWRGQEEEIHARWVVDCTGRAALLARQLGLRRELEEHPTAALWARFRGVQDWDSHALRSRHSRYGSTVLCSRGAATNHLMGYGWWCWIIPLRGGDVSAGLVFDTRLFRPPAGGSPGERLLTHLRSHPVGREIFANAEPIAGDIHARARLPYYSEKIAGPGWQLAGDAAGFIDPLYSPGMDFLSWTSRLAAWRIGRELRGYDPELDRLNRDWRRSYRAWFEALYKDKYYHLGDAELMSAAFYLDIGLFFLGPGWEAIRNKGGCDGHCLPFTGKPDYLVSRFMAFYNQRLSAIARKRRAAGCYGRRNTGWQELNRDMKPGWSVARPLLRGLRRWIAAEWQAAFLPKSADAAPLAKPMRENSPRTAIGAEAG